MLLPLLPCRSQNLLDAVMCWFRELKCSKICYCCCSELNELMEGSECWRWHRQQEHSSGRGGGMGEQDLPVSVAVEHLIYLILWSHTVMLTRTCGILLIPWISPGGMCRLQTHFLTQSLGPSLVLPMLCYNWVENIGFAGRPPQNHLFISCSVCVLKQRENKHFCAGKHKFIRWIRGQRLDESLKEVVLPKPCDKCLAKRFLLDLGCDFFSLQKKVLWHCAIWCVNTLSNMKELTFSKLTYVNFHSP